MKTAMLEPADFIAFGVKSSAEKGIALPDLQRAFLRAVRVAYPPGDGLVAAANSNFWSLMRRDGGSLPASKAAKLYGGSRPVTTEALRKAAKAGQLIGVQDGLGEWLFPVWQFGERGGTLPGLREVLRALREGHPAYNDLTPMTFFLNPSPHLEGKTPLEALREGRLAAVTEQALAAQE